VLKVKYPAPATNSIRTPQSGTKPRAVPVEVLERSSTSFLVYEKVNELFRSTVGWYGRSFIISAF